MPDSRPRLPLTLPPTPTLPLLALALLLAVPAAHAQEPAATFGEKVEVTEVLLDVLVTDAQGNIILGLDEGDFIVEQDGRKVDVTSSTFYSNRRYVDSADLAGRLGVSSADLPVDRYFILFFDEPRRNDISLTANTLDAVRRAKDWIYQEMLPNDWVAIVRWDGRLQIYQDFTTDDQLLIGALDSFAKGRNPGDVWASRIGESQGPSLAVNLPRGKDLRKQTTRIYNALSTLAEAAGYITGRKNVLFFSLGFGELNDFGTYVPDERYYGPMMEALNDNNVAVYTISWYENLADEAPGVDILGNGLSLLASDTGGRYYFNFVDFKAPFEKVTEENNGYYLLSYSAEHPQGESGYERVSVRTANPDFVVRARQGYRYGG